MVPRSPDDPPERAGRLTGADVLAHCLGKPGAWRDEPWEGDVVVKVADKIFAFTSEGSRSVGLKCAPTRLEADEWLREYPEDARVMPYIGRSGWNILALGGAIPDEDLLAAVDESYRLVVGRLPKSRRP